MPEDVRPAADDGRDDEPGRSGADGPGPDDAKSADSAPGSDPSASGATPGGGQPANPLEALFSQLGLGSMGGIPMGAGQAGFSGPADLSGLLQQLQQAFASMGGGSMFAGPTAGSGSGVNWDVTRDVARKTVASLGSDPTPSAPDRRAINEAVSIAEVWLDAATSFPQLATTVAVWSRADWVENTMPVWRRLVEPVAASIADAMEGALKFSGESEDASAFPGMAGMEQMLRPMLRTSGASMFGLQLGQGLGQLAAEVVGATDIGLPLSEEGQVVLLPTNVKAFGQGLQQSATDVTLYLALRECARQRLFASAGWLRSQMLTLVEEYARGITIDTSALEQAVSQIDPTNLEELSQSLEGGLFEPQKTPEQVATLERLETMLALVEGWVDDVVTQATAPWMPAAAALAETVRRNRATGGPAEATFATLVGLELRPRRLRDAADLWAAIREARGADGRDAVWTHPDLIPTSADLDHPLGFLSGDTKSQHEEDFDAALAALLEAGGDSKGSDSAEVSEAPGREDRPDVVGSEDHPDVVGPEDRPNEPGPGDRPNEPDPGEQRD